MGRALAAFVAGIAVLGACSGNDDVDAVSAAPQVAVDEQQAAEERSGELLLVGAGEGFETLAVLDPDSGELDPVETPAEIGGSVAWRAVVGDGGEHVLVATADEAVYLWDRRTDDTTLVGFGSRFLEVAPAHTPVAVLVETNQAWLVVDLRRGTVHDVPASGRALGPRLAVDAAGTVAIVAHPTGGATAVDLVDGTVEHHDPDLLFFQHGLSADGSVAVAGRRTDHGFAIEAVPTFDPTSPQVWYRPDRPVAQVSVAWVGGEVLAVDLSGRVMTVTGGVVTELGHLPAPEEAVASGLVHADPVVPTSPTALIEQRGAAPSRWFRVDVATGVIEELPGIEGHSIVPSTLAGHLVVGVGTFDDGFSSLQLVRPADGASVELVDDATAPRVLLVSVSDAIVGLTRFDDSTAETELLHVAGEPWGTIPARLRFVANSSVSRVALFHPEDPSGGEEPVTRIVTVDGSATDVVHPGLHPLAWLPAT